MDEEAEAEAELRAECLWLGVAYVSPADAEIRDLANPRRRTLGENARKTRRESIKKKLRRKAEEIVEKSKIGEETKRMILLKLRVIAKRRKTIKEQIVNNKKILENGANNTALDV